MLGWFKKRRKPKEFYGPFTAELWHWAFRRDFRNLDAVPGEYGIPTGDPINEVDSALSKAVPDQPPLPALIVSAERVGVRVLALIKAGLESRRDCEEAMVAALSDDSELVRRTAALALLRLGNVRGLAAVAAGSRHGHGVRTEAAAALSDLGVDAKEAVPALFLLLRYRDINWRSHMAASSALAAVGEAATPYLAFALQHGSNHTRYYAAVALQETGLCPEYDDLIVEILEAHKIGVVR